MIERTHYGILSFKNSQAAAQAELAMEEEFECRLIPLPPQLSKGCGLVLQFPWSEVTRFSMKVQEKRMHHEGIYEVILSNARNKTVIPWKGVEER